MRSLLRILTNYTTVVYVWKKIYLLEYFHASVLNYDCMIYTFCEMH